MISPAIIFSRVTEKMIKRRPVIAPVKSSLPFFTCSALSAPVMIWMVAISIMTSEMAPAIPARKVRRAELKPAVEVGMQPRPVLIWGLRSELPVQPAVGSSARAGRADKYRVWSIEYRTRVACARIETCFLSGKNFFIRPLLSS